MFREEGTLLKVGVALMALAVALVIAAVVVSVALRGGGGGSEGVVAAEAAATKGSDEPLGYSSGEEGSATRKSSSEEQSPRYSSGEEEEPDPSSSSSSSSSYGGSLSHQEGEAKGLERVASASELGAHNSQKSAMPQQAGGQTPSAEGHSSEPQSPEPRAQQHHPDGEQRLPGAEGGDWAEPTPQEIQEANHPRHYGLAPGAIMALSIPKIGIYDAPVYDSVSYWALANGIAHNPETSLPWSDTPQRNVYLAGHRMGFRGTWSRMLFYNLDKLEAGDKVVLRDREGRTYTYRVSEVFEAAPTDVWVMGQVRGRDMVTLQTCTPIPTFERRLIVRADRV